MATDPNPLNNYGVALVPRVSPNAGDTTGKVIARVGLLTALGITPAATTPVTFSEPFTKAAHTRQLYPNGPAIPVRQSVSMVTTVGGTNSLLSGESWTLELNGQSFGIRVLELRARDLVQFFSGKTTVGTGDFLVSPRGKIYPLSGTAGPTTLGAAGQDTLGTPEPVPAGMV
jgi:hypothetical protein